MIENTAQLLELSLDLPSAAPTVRVTAGIGTATQKTWNLRRPITLIGSRRPAHILLHDQGVARAHCVIVNTGAEVLIKDLHTAEGTFCNKNRVDLAILNDGDVITVGETRLQIAIQSGSRLMDDSGLGMEIGDPLKFPEPVLLRTANGDKQWRVDDAVALIGRHESAAVVLDHEDISARHAVIFRFIDRPAVYDLGSRTGLSVGDSPCAQARLKDGSNLVFGPVVLVVGTGNQVHATASSSVAAPPPASQPIAANQTSANNIVIPELATVSARHSTSAGSSTSASSAAASTSSSNDTGPAGLPPRPAPSIDLTILKGQQMDPVRSLAHIETELTNLQTNLAESWERLNSWQGRLVADATALNKHETDLAAREAMVDVRDAELRGQFHDMTRYQEQLAARERELTEQLNQLRAEREAFETEYNACREREAEIQKRSEDLQRREHVFAQRWSRLLAAKCSHCGKPVNTGERGKN